MNRWVGASPAIAARAQMPRAVGRVDDAMKDEATETEAWRTQAHEDDVAYHDRLVLAHRREQHAGPIRQEGPHALAARPNHGPLPTRQRSADRLRGRALGELVSLTVAQDWGGSCSQPSSKV